MKKKHIILTLLMALAFAAHAERVEILKGAMFGYMSENGRYVAQRSNNGTIIFDRETSKPYTYSSQHNFGLGNSFADDGTIVGRTSENIPAYWKDGEWHPLPMRPADANCYYAAANGITPDGSRIVGVVGCSGWPGYGEMLVAPIYWDRGEDGLYQPYNVLPNPSRDITGRWPQYATALHISADGRTILGQMQDYSGMLCYQLIYKEDEQGRWTYTQCGADDLVKPGAKWPEYPQTPVEPEVEKYITQDEIRSYNAAMQAYRDSVNSAPITGKNPQYYPQPADFIKANRAKWEKDQNTYKAAMEDYNLGIEKFKVAWKTFVRGSSYRYNGIKLSRSGKYYSANYNYPDPNPEPGTTPVGFISPKMYSMDSPDAGTLSVMRNAGVFSISDEGVIMAASPVSGSDVKYARTPYIIYPGHEPEEFITWVEREHPDTYQWLSENLTFSATIYETDESGNLVEVTLPPTIYPGTLSANTTMRRFIGYLYNPDTGGGISYLIDLDAPTNGVEDAENTPVAVWYQQEGRTLHILGDGMADTCIYNLDGTLVYSGSTSDGVLSLQSLPNGAYIARTSVEGKTVATTKLIIR